VGPFYQLAEPSGGALPFVCSPFGFNFDTSLVSRGVVTKAAPSPILGTNAQSFADRVTVNVAELPGELAVVPDVGVIVSLLPKVFGLADQTARHSLFEQFNRHCECFLVRLGKQEVNMLGHDHIAVDTELKLRRTRSRASSKASLLASERNNLRRR
jgi:hypothetical protein